MNILIISFDSDPPYMGGVATITNILAKNFILHNHFCALGYMDDSEHPSFFFKHKIKLVKENRENIKKFLYSYNFDIIFVQLPTRIDFKFLLSVLIGNCKIVSVYHSRPMLHFSLFDNLIRIYRESNNFCYKVYTLGKIPFLPLFWIVNRISQINKFRDINNYSNKVVLLSNKFIPNWINLSPKIDIDKLIAIGNPLVFDKSLPIEEIKDKEHLVVIIYSNPAKRANLLLEIWKEIEKDSNFDNWKFDFVGEGEGFSHIQQLASKLNLQRINFVGYQNPYPFYRRASIMMMTSKYEGWPIALMEGLQMGVIPISYNSFESITDIINDGENGFIIPNNDKDCFVKKMKELMLNSKERQRMAEIAIASSQRFNCDEVVKKYLNLFSELLKEN